MSLKRVVVTGLGAVSPYGAGMELFIDGNNIGRAYFTRCFAEGCYVEVEIDDELMKILRAGKSAVFALRESADQDRVGIPIELTGFAEGYDALP